MKTARSKATDISQSVKQRVWERDNQCCVVCGSHIAMPNAHILPRSSGGLGIETNIVTLCTNFSPNKCHYRFDFGTKKEKEKILKIITKYMKSIYGDEWNIEDQKYKRW